LRIIFKSAPVIDNTDIEGHRDLAWGTDAIFMVSVFLTALALPLTRIGKAEPGFPPSWMIVMALVLILGWHQRHAIFKGIGEIRQAKWGGSISSSFIWLIGGLCTGVVIVSYAIYFFDSYGTIFAFWDAIVSWNRWALDWAANTIPTSTWFYPQLLPANRSIAYVLTGFTFQFIPKIFMGFFFFGCAALFVHLALSRREPAFLFGLGLFYLIMQRQDYHINEGLADLPMAFFALCIAGILLTEDDVQNDSPKGFFSRFHLGVWVTCAAALTKQAGIFLLVMMPLLVFWQNKCRIRSSQFFLWLASVLTLVVPWFLLCWIKAAESSLKITKMAIIDAHLGRDLWQRGAYAWKLVANLGGGGAVVIVAIALILYSMKRSYWRPFVLLLTIPYALIWWYLFSYDTRNLFMILPLATVGCIIGLTDLLRKIKLVWRLVFVIIPVLALVYFSPNPNVISGYHEGLQMNWYNAPINRYIMENINEKRLVGTIVTRYQILAFLPRLKSRVMLWSAQMDLEAILNFSTLKRVRYVLGTPEDFTPRSLKSIREKIDSGEFTLVGQPQGWLFVKIR
jgi:hypothetical protein